MNCTARQLILTIFIGLVIDAIISLSFAAQSTPDLAELERQKIAAQEYYNQRRELYYQGKISRAELIDAETKLTEAMIKVDKAKAGQQSAAEKGEKDTESPQYFRRAMKELIDARDDDPQRPYPQTRKLKQVMNGALFLCHLIETNAHIAGEIYLQTEKPSDLERAGKTIKSVKTCAAESEKAIQPLIRTARVEVQKKPAALSKLKSYVGTWLGLIRALPRQAHSRGENNLFQQRDRKSLNGKEGELDVELLM